MDLFRAKLIVSLLAGGLILGSIVGIIFYYVLPQYYSGWFGGNLLFFLVIETIIIYVVEAASRRMTSRQLLNTYLMTKVIKIFAALIYVGIYAFAVKTEIKNFVLGFMTLYLIFLFVETFLFMKIEKRLKKKQ